MAEQNDPQIVKALAALDTMATVWAAKVNARHAVRVMLACSDAEDRLLNFVKQAHAEGLFEGFHAGKERGAAPSVHLAGGESSVSARKPVLPESETRRIEAMTEQIKAGRLRWKKHERETGLRAIGARPRGSYYTDGVTKYATVYAHSTMHTGKKGWWWASSVGGQSHNRSDLEGLTEEEAKQQAQEYVKATLAKLAREMAAYSAQQANHDARRKALQGKDLHAR